MPVLLVSSARVSNDDSFGVLLGVTILTLCCSLMSFRGVGTDVARFCSFLTSVSVEASLGVGLLPLVTDPIPPGIPLPPIIFLAIFLALFGGLLGPSGVCTLGLGSVSGSTIASLPSLLLKSARSS